MAAHIRSLKLKDTIASSLKPMSLEHVVSAHALLSDYLEKYVIVVVLNVVCLHFEMKLYDLFV